MNLRTLLFLSLAGILMQYPVSASGQATYSATRKVRLQVGVGGSVAFSDYGYKSSPLVGGTIYGSMDFGRHFGLTGDIHRTSIISPDDIGEATYLLGVRYATNVRTSRPYVKAQIGAGRFNFYKGNIYARDSDLLHKVYAFGAGVDVPLSNRINLRLLDYEYQFWPGVLPHGLNPSVLTVGVAYRFRK